MDVQWCLSLMSAAIQQASGLMCSQLTMCLMAKGLVVVCFGLRMFSTRCVCANCYLVHLFIQHLQLSAIVFSLYPLLVWTVYYAS